MKLKFKDQDYQTDAVNAVVDCFEGQPNSSFRPYRMDLGRATQARAFDKGFKNAGLTLNDEELRENIEKVQQRQNLTASHSLTDFTVLNSKGARVPVKASYREAALAATRFHIDVEMETGTGKTYCYLKTIFEMNKRYGWSKFIIIVPSVAIREGVFKSLQITEDHFAESYGKKARFFIYNSNRLHELESFSSEAGLNVMVINIQAFNSTSKANKRIDKELDDFQSRKPIDVIASNRPILILDEPQKMEGTRTMDALPKFKPLFILRYSATHRTQHNLVHRLDALDAYNQKLVKKVAVHGIQTRGIAGSNDAYLYLEGIDISKKAPVARIELNVKLKSGEYKRQLRRLKSGDDLFVKSGKLDQYRNFKISQIDARKDEVKFTNGEVLRAGEVTGDASEGNLRRIQIRETIRAHLDKEKQLFSQGIKVLSLFFIDEVVKYRDYDAVDEKGEYARIFEEEYEVLKDKYLSELPIDNVAYREYLDGIDPTVTHNGYFSIDQKTKRFKDSDVKAGSGNSKDVDAYDLILKDKEQLLSFDEPTRFIFSHSALREGWDNPNVFVMCMLKHKGNVISRRQEVGRGLRLSVNQHGDRMDDPVEAHDVNVLTVVASESYKDFVTGLQKEIAETIAHRPKPVTKEYFTGELLTTETGMVEVTVEMAEMICLYLEENSYVDDAGYIVAAYHKAKAAKKLADLPDNLKPYEEEVFLLIDSVFTQLPKVNDGRKAKTNPLNANFYKKEFQELWERINCKAVYRVDLKSAQLIKDCVKALNRDLRVTPLRYIVRRGMLSDELTDDQIRSGDGFEETSTTTEYGESIQSFVKYDLVGKVAENTQLTRNTVAKILERIAQSTFEKFKENPEHFIAEASRIIAQQKAIKIVDGLDYNKVDERYGDDLFKENQTKQDFSLATAQLKKHVYDYLITDSKLEKKFANELDKSTEVTVYAKLPRKYLIKTPVGEYNPDWAVSFEAGSVRYIYFVVETKGTSSQLELPEIVNAKTDCAHKFFEEISPSVPKDAVKYEVVACFSELMDRIK